MATRVKGYSPEMPFAERPSRLREAWGEVRAVVRYQELVRHLMRRSMARESTGRIFGALWWLLDPLILVAVYVFFVDVILQRGGENYALFVAVGILLWKHLSSGVVSAMTSTLAREQAMRQVAFPRAVLPLAAILAETIHLLIGFAAYVVVAAFFGVYLSEAFLLVVPLLAIHLMLALGLGFGLAALNILYRDIQNLTTYALRVGFFLSPILYPLALIPESVRLLYLANPYATLIPAFQDVMLHQQQPDWVGVAVVAAGALAVFAAGFVTFTRLERQFAKLS